MSRPAAHLGRGMLLPASIVPPGQPLRTMVTSGHQMRNGPARPQREESIRSETCRTDALPPHSLNVKRRVLNCCRYNSAYGRRDVDRLTSAAAVFTLLRTIGPQKPDSERQVRPLIGPWPCSARKPIPPCSLKKSRNSMPRSGRCSLDDRPKANPDRAEKPLPKQTRAGVRKTAHLR